MQPTYLPWAGYFNLMSQVDKFTFLDDVQFERRSWQSRNRILLQGNELMLTIPVNKVDRGTQISKITICGKTEWQKDHWQALKSAYRQAPYGSEILDILEPFYQEEPPLLLSEFNQQITWLIALALGLKTTLIRATDLQCPGHRSMHLIKICETLRCDEYISPQGSKDYLEKDNFICCTQTRLTFHEYVPIPYPQINATGFVTHLSIVDVIANLGIQAAKSYIS